MEGDVEPYRVLEEQGQPEVNRFAGDWISLHLFSTLYWLTERHQSAYAFLKNGGMKWAEKVRHLTPEALATSARLAAGGGGIQSLLYHQNVPQLVREALNAMQLAFANVLGTDGHRRLCRHEGLAYMTLFGPPVLFCTPNLADTKQLLLLVVQGSEIHLDDRHLADDSLPRYRDMMQRLARDPVGQTRVFELVMQLFFVHVLGVRPECLQNRRRVSRRYVREWCTDGIAASSSAPGILGPVHAFRGEIEAQGRGSLHPHILVWLVNVSSLELLRLLSREPESLKSRLASWMRTTVRAVESTTQASIRALPRRFGLGADVVVPSLPFSRQERALSRYDGGCELDALREEISNGLTPTAAQTTLLNQGNRDAWCRPCLPLLDNAGVPVGDGSSVHQPKVSVYTKSLKEFAVSSCPSYRRLAAMRKSSSEIHGSDMRGDAGRHELLNPDEARVWEQSFGLDVRRLGSELLVHICGDSCFKYSGSKTTHICRHGFYYVVSLEDWRRRRRGKALRNSICIVQQSKFGMQGRLLPIQEHPFECQSNYAAVAALRCNFDMQDLRRVLPATFSLEGELPHTRRPTFLGMYECVRMGWRRVGVVPLP